MSSKRAVGRGMAAGGRGLEPSRPPSDDEDVDVVGVTPSSRRSTRSGVTRLPKNELDDLPGGLVHCPVCGLGVFSDDGCKTIECSNEIHKLEGKPKILRFCVFCRKQCKEGDRVVICDQECPWHNSRENREMVAAQRRQTVDLCSSEDEGGKEAASESATTPSSDVSSGQSSETEGRHKDSDDESWHGSNSDYEGDDSSVDDAGHTPSEAKDGIAPPAKRIKADPMEAETDEDEATPFRPIKVKMEDADVYEKDTDTESPSSDTSARGHRPGETEELHGERESPGGQSIEPRVRATGKQESRGVGKAFLKRLDELKAYKAKHGHVNVKKGEDKSLAKFCVGIRYARRHPGSSNKVTVDLIASLNELGFDWAPQNNRGGRPFEERLEELKEYKNKQGHLNVTASEDKSLYDFCYQVRRASKGHGSMKLDEERIASLDAIEFEWEPRRHQGNAAFQERVESLKDKAKHGHLKVKESEDKRLYLFCQSVRRAHRGPGTMKLTNERIAALDALGFNWEPDTFQERIEELAAYKAKYGHTKVKASEDKSLYNFCSSFRCARRGTGRMKLTLTEERISALVALGFDWI